MSDTFRRAYRALTDSEKQAMEDTKTAAESLETIYEALKVAGKNPRQLALAMTKLEESVMWAVKAITE